MSLSEQLKYHVLTVLKINNENKKFTDEKIKIIIFAVYKMFLQFGYNVSDINTRIIFKDIKDEYDEYFENKKICMKENL